MTMREMLKILIRMKLLLQWRSYTRNVSTLVAVIAFALMFLPGIIMVTVVSFFGMTYLEPPANGNLLAGILTLIYLVWLVMPLIGSAFSDGYDITRLFHYPVAPRVLFTAAVLGSFLDLMTVLAMPLLLIAIIAFTNSLPALIFVLLALLIFIFQMLALSQTLVLAGAGVLRSRRWRDLMLLLVPIIFMAIVVAPQFFLNNSLHTFFNAQSQLVNWSQLFSHPAWNLLAYFPPGMAARAIAAAHAGHFAITLLFLGLLCVVSLLTVYVAGWLVGYVATGQVVGTNRRAQNTPIASAKPGKVGLWRQIINLLPAQLGAMFEKECKFLVRDPSFRSYPIMIFFIMIIAVFWFMRPMSHGPQGLFVQSDAIWLALMYVLASESSLLFNTLGTEGKAITTLLLLPVARRDILLGKNIMAFIVLSFTNAVIVAALAGLAHVPERFPILLVFAELVVIFMAAAGNFCSVYYPMRTASAGWRMKSQMTGQQYTNSLIQTGCLFGTGFAALPILAAVVVPIYFLPPVWFALTLPLATAYTAGAYAVSLHFAPKLLEKREQKIMELLVQDEK
jgi:ABC-2 type transport system permease protein